MEGKKRAAILVRVSTDSQDYERQLHELRQVASTQGYIVDNDDEYSEKISGRTKNEDREELNRLMVNIRTQAKNYHMVFAYEVSRISRNPTQGRKIIDELTDLGICVYISSTGLKTLDENGERNGWTNVVFQAMIEQARMEADTIARRFASGKKYNATVEGKFVGGAVKPYGYTTDASKKLILDLEESEVVKSMYQMASEGYGSRQISNFLKAKGIKSKTGKEWNETGIPSLLKNPLYKGQRRYKGGLYNNVPAVVDEKLWNKVQADLKERNFTKDRNVKYLYLLQRKIYCGVCGKIYVAKTKGSRDSEMYKECHYGCYSRVHGKSACTNAGISIPKMESVVWSVVMHHPNLPEFIKNNQKELQAIEKEIMVLSAEELNLENKIIDKRKELTGYDKLFVKGRITEQEYDTATDRIDRAIDTLETKLNKTQHQVRAKQEVVEKAHTRDTYIDAMLSIGNDRLKIADVLPNIVEKVVINSGKFTMCDEFIISIYFYGSSNPIIVYFNKRSMLRLMKPMDSVSVIYEKNILKNEVRDIISFFKSPMEGREHLEGLGQCGFILAIDLLPFSMIDIRRTLKKKKVAESETEIG